jgi:trk system potassium uptake protein TrkH
MQIFRTESSDQSDKIFGRGYDLVIWIAGIYVGLTLLAAIAYGALGMSLFDAINHGMSSIATGGFSTHDASIGFFKSPQIEWVATLFMLAGALPMTAYIRAVRGRRRAFFDDIQVQGFILFLAAVSLLLAVTLTLQADRHFFEALRRSAFHVVSIVTTTGFVSEDYSLWGPHALGAFFVLTFIGGCSGSTAGGIKMYRLQILLKLAHAHLQRLVSPSRTVVVSYSTRRVDDEIEIAILTYLVAMLVSTAVFTAILGWLGLDLVTALTASASSLNNVGPGLGHLIGPAGNFAQLSDPVLGVLSLAMILGRLEFFTLLVLLTPAFWRG